VARRTSLLGETVERSGHARGIALAFQLQANRAERLGNLAEADSSARPSVEFMRQSEAGVGAVAWILCSLVEVLVDRGELAEAEAALAHMPAGEWPPHAACISTLAARGRLRVVQNHVDEGLADLLAVGRHYENWPGFASMGCISHPRPSRCI
jgi:hypothetical protein